jgi:hypothetical protein
MLLCHPSAPPMICSHSTAAASVSQSRGDTTSAIPTFTELPVSFPNNPHVTHVQMELSAQTRKGLGDLKSLSEAQVAVLVQQAVLSITAPGTPADALRMCEFVCLAWSCWRCSTYSSLTHHRRHARMIVALGY